MGNILLRLLILVAGFCITFGVLRMVDWMTVLQVKELGDTTEEKLGKLYWDLFKTMEEEEDRVEVTGPVDTILTHLCRANDIDRSRIKLHIVDSDNVNAFALPDYHMVVFTGLIDDCETESELAGVIAHELAHMESGHIMKKLVKEIGLSVLISMTSGKGSPELIREAVRILSSTAYDRSLESEADMTGVDYMIKAEMDPEGLANFLFRMSAAEKDLPRQLFWITTHPGSEERMKTILNYIEGQRFDVKPVLDSVQWFSMQTAL